MRQGKLCCLPGLHLQEALSWAPSQGCLQFLCGQPGSKQPSWFSCYSAHPLKALLPVPFLCHRLRPVWNSSLDSIWTLLCSCLAQSLLRPNHLMSPAAVNKCLCSVAEDNWSFLEVDSGVSKSCLVKEFRGGCILKKLLWVIEIVYTCSSVTERYSISPVSGLYRGTTVSGDWMLWKRHFLCRHRLDPGTRTGRGFKIQLSYQEISLTQHAFGLDVSLWSLSRRSKKTLCLSFLILENERKNHPYLKGCLKIKWVNISRSTWGLACGKRHKRTTEEPVATFCWCPSSTPA